MDPELVALIGLVASIAVLLHFKNVVASSLQAIRLQFASMASDNVDWAALFWLATHKNRREWQYAQSHEWYDEWVVGRAHPAGFKRFFGINADTATRLVELLSESLKKKDTNFRKAVPVEKKILLTIQYMRTGENLFALGRRFGIGESTACQYVMMCAKP